MHVVKELAPAVLRPILAIDYYRYQKILSNSVIFNFVSY